VPILYLRVFKSCSHDSDLETFEPFAGMLSFAAVQKVSRWCPEQMRRAVKDYKYEVNESHMTEECSQYLAQLQKDWERHRVKLGVEALRKEVRFFALLLGYTLTC
jgi:hypothetical protein